MKKEVAKILNYLPLIKKVEISTLITTRYIYSTAEVQEVRIAELHRDIFFYGLLGGYGCIDCNDMSLITFENYDKLYPIFAPFITSYCSTDYKNFKEFVHDALDSYGLNSFIETLGGLNEEALQTVTDDNKNLVSELEKHKDLIMNLGEIAKINSPLAQGIVDELNAIALKESNK